MDSDRRVMERSSARPDGRCSGIFRCESLPGYYTTDLPSAHQPFVQSLTCTNIQFWMRRTVGPEPAIRWSPQEPGGLAPGRRSARGIPEPRDSGISFLQLVWLSIDTIVSVPEQVTQLRRAVGSNATGRAIPGLRNPGLLIRCLRLNPEVDRLRREGHVDPGSVQRFL